MPRAPRDRARADLDARLGRCGEMLAKAQRERDLAEARGRRWLEDLCALDDEIGRLMRHIEAEVRAGKARAIHHHLYERLLKAREAARLGSS
jgi:hypothetical protein